MMHRHKILILLLAFLMMVAIALVALASLAPILHAQALPTDDTTSGDNVDTSFGASNFTAPSTSPTPATPTTVTNPAPTDLPLNLGSSNPGSPTVPLTSTYSNSAASPQTPSVATCTTGTCGWVVCDAVSSSNGGSGQTICDFNELLIEARTIITNLFLIAIPIAIVLFAYGGILYIIGTPGNRSKANGIFTATGIGFGIMLIAWVSVYTVVSWLTTGSNTSSGGITTFLGQGQ